MKIISRITLIMTAVAGIVFGILGVAFMGMAAHMNSVIASTSTGDVVEAVQETTESSITTVEAAEALPNFTSGGANAMLVVGIILLIYGIACAVISIIALKKLEVAKNKKEIKPYGILACIFSFVAPGVFLLRLTDAQIREKEDEEEGRR